MDDALSEAFKALVDELVVKAEAGDTLAIRCLAALALVCEGSPAPDGGGTVLVDLAEYRQRRAA